MRKQYQICCPTADGNVVLGCTDTVMGIKNIVKQFMSDNEGSTEVVIKENDKGRYAVTDKFNELIDDLYTAYWFN